MAVGHITLSRKRILNAVFWSMASSWVTKLIDVAVMLVLARLLTPADFGLVAIVTIYIALGNVFVKAGFAQAIIQRDEIDDSHLNTAFWTSLAVGITLTISTFIFGPTAFEYLFKEPGLGPIIEVTSLLFTVAALQSVQQALLTRQLAFKQLAIRRGIGTLIGGVIAIVLAYRGFGVWSLVALNLTSAVVSLAVLWTVSNWRPHFQFSIRCFHDLFVFGIHIVGFELLAFFNRRGISLIIGLFLGPTALGYFVLASKIVRSIMALFGSAIQAVALPAFSRLQANQRKLRDTFYQSIRFTSLVTVPTYLWISLQAELLIPLMLGHQWGPSVPVLQVLCFLGILESVTRYTHTMLLACGKANWSLRISIVQAIAIYIGFFVSVEWGIVGVAAVRVGIAYLLAPIGVAAARRLVDFTYSSYLSQLRPALVASTIMSAVILISKTVIPDDFESTLQLLALAILGAVSYIASIYWMNRSVFMDARRMLAELLPALGERKGEDKR